MIEKITGARRVLLMVSAVESKLTDYLLKASYVYMSKVIA